MKAGRLLLFFGCVLIVGCVVMIHFWGRKKHREEPITPEEGNKSNSDLLFTLESVNSWLNNCDQKAGILLAVVGVAITVIMTSDFMKYLRAYIFIPFMEYCSGKSNLSFSWSRFTVFFLLLISIIILITCCIYLFKAIRANIDYEKMYKENPNLVKVSYIFFGTISRMKYDDFKKGPSNFDEDLKSQIFVNSIIASNKFKDYNEGLFWFKLLLLVAVFLFVAIMFVQ